MGSHARLVAATIATLCALGAGPVAAAEPTRISAGTPLAGLACKGSEPGREAEPSVATDPADVRHIVVAWQQDRGHGTVVATTFDGGTTWSRTVVDGFSGCTGGAYSWSSHARLAFGPGGALYLAGMNSDGFNAHSLVARSPDGGVSWSQPRRADLANGPDAANDFDGFAVDRRTGALSVVWSPLEGTEATLLARSTDGGHTWRQHLVRTAAPGTAAWNRLVARRNGRLVLIFQDAPVADLFQPVPVPAVMRATVSRDGGRTWSPPVAIGWGAALQWPGAAEAPDGTLYASWVQAQPGGACKRQVVFPAATNVGGDCRVVVARSTDGGRTWRAPVQVMAWSGHWAPFPELAVASDGTVGVQHTTYAGEVATAWVSHSADRGATWSHARLGDSNVPVTPGDPEVLGLYQELAPRGCGFAAAFAQGPPAAATGKTDVFFATVEPPRCTN